MGGIDPTPEVCDNVDNDCNGLVDDEISSDQYEANNSCSAATNGGNAIENQDPLVITASLYDPAVSTGDDVDWYKITAKEGGGFCNPLSGSEGPFTVTITLKNIPDGSDYDLCVWNPEGQTPVTDSDGQIKSWTEGGESNSCNSLPNSWPPDSSDIHNETFGQEGECMEQQHFETGSTEEKYTFTWTGKCLQNDDQTFYVKVLAWSVNPDIDCAPYNLEVKVTK